MWYKVCGLRSLALRLVRWNLGRTENIGRKMRWKIEFFSIWKWEENKRNGKREKIFCPDPQIFFPPIRMEYQWEKTVSLLLYHKTLPPSLLHALHLPHLKTFAHISSLCPIQAHVNGQPILCKGVMFGWNAWKKKEKRKEKGNAEIWEKKKRL